MLDLFLDTLLDSLIILALVFATEVILSFFEGKIARWLEGSKRFAPALGSLGGIIPQCGVSVVAGDLYLKDHITIGTVIAVFLACSDEALPILFSNFTSTWWLTFVLIGAKIVIAAGVGLLVDLFFRRRNAKVHEHLENCEGEEETHHGCCGHEIEGEESPVKTHLVHPIIHSLKIWAYVFVISYAFALLMYPEWPMAEHISAFLSANRYLSPIAASLIGLIPNCASSVLLSELFLQNAIPFGALLSGLLVNAGLGMLIIFRDKNHRKAALAILGICFATSLAFGYLFLLLPY